MLIYENKQFQKSSQVLGNEMRNTHVKLECLVPFKIQNTIDQNFTNISNFYDRKQTITTDQLVRKVAVLALNVLK